MVTALLLRARAGFVVLDRATRDIGVYDDLSPAALHDDARRLHNRWDAVFRTGTPITERPHLLRPAVVMSAVLMMIAIAPYRDGRLMVL